ncbi:hypothetical protein As57867_014085, partial [Aphanomyces stellatus]
MVAITPPAILAHPSTAFAVQFSGQATEYIDELSLLVESYDSVRSFVEDAQTALFEEATPLGLTIRPFLWTQGRAFQPPKDILTSAPVSYPLIFISQVANYLGFLEAAKTTHENVLQKIRVGAGHSQGIVAALLLATATTQDELFSLAVKFVRYMFLHGVRAQVTASNNNLANNNNLSPMLLVRGLDEVALRNVLDTTNSKLQLDGPHTLQVSLINSVDSIVVTGAATSLAVLQTTLSQLSRSLESQAHLPFSQRKPLITSASLAVSCPFHNAILAPAQVAIEADLARLGLIFPGDALQFAVLGTNGDAVNLQTYDRQDVMPAVVRMQLCDVVRWPVTVKAMNTMGLTHVLDFGPSVDSASLTQKQLEGFGVVVVVPSTFHQPTDMLPGLDYIMTSQYNYVGSSWEDKFGPRIHHTSDGVAQLANKYTARFGRQPFWVGGMNPTTSLRGIPLLTAITESGYIGELAGDGLHTEADLDRAVSDLASRISPGRGIFFNLAYFRRERWATHFARIKKMRQRGIPVQGFTISAGVPSPDVSKSILTDLLAAQIYVVGFKPGTIDAILAVLDIAKKFPQATIVLQWTGGRAGGHHSCEDFHMPLLATYAAIRRVSNVILVVGSGFGSAEQAYPYLTGDWSLAFDQPKMPCDAILIASRVMAAIEAATADAVKDLLVQMPGIPDDSDWEDCYETSAGGVVTIKSELGYDIHKIGNRGAICWRDFDRKYFSLPPHVQEAAILADKDAIIARVNADFQRPYFGRTLAGNVVDLDFMTYLDVLSRMVSLMYTAKSKSWFHPTYMTRVMAFVQRTDERFASTSADHVCVLESQVNTDPWAVVASLEATYPDIARVLLCGEDIDFFIHLCKVGGKPVNFIPVIDKDLIVWFKKDSLWCSEVLEAVPDEDAGRVMILHGPMALHHVKTKN